MNAPAIVDSHCHLDFETFEDERDEVIARARQAGVCRMVTISTRVTTFPKIRAIAEQYDDVFCSVGIHPHQAGEEPEVSVEELVALAEHPKVVGIGESGLDYFYDSAPRDAQRRSFTTHIRAAQETGLPLIVHARDADDDTADLLEAEYARKPYTGVLHCFSSGRRLAERALDIGFYVSLSGIITFKNAEDVRSTVRDVPLDRLLVETDSPYLAPVPKRGKRNEPAYVAHTHAALAGLRGLPEAEMAGLTTRNFFRLFSRVPVPADLDLDGAA
ncbi:TatD family hydrolase [Nisaea sp.]|uniref:TatD family hydrolase n=1 Tax=Nisaea sp. TaxID=2024842 RepID=UPI0032EB86F0